MLALKIENLQKTYDDGTEALKGIDLKVEAGDFFALLGANGAGKTTVIGILTGLVNKSEGLAEIYGHNIETHLHQAKNLTGVVPQEMNFNQFEKVKDIVLNQAGLFGISRRKAYPRMKELLEQLELWGKRDTISRSLSGGMKRRLMIARALINKPDLLILDEPTAGVDVELRQSMWEFLIKLNKQGTTILLTTHYLEEVEQLCRRAAMIKKGVIIKNDTVKNLIHLVDKETFVLHVEKLSGLDKLKVYNPRHIDENTFEVEITKKDHMNAFIKDLGKTDMDVIDIRPKGNRIEKLFLSILQQK